MEILFLFMGFLTVLNYLTGVKGGVCPGYNIPVIWPCSDGTISGTKLLVDTSDIPIDMLQCNCKITTTTNEIQINLIKAPEYRNCGTEITFSTALSSKFGCFGGGTIVNTSAIKSVDVLVDKENTIADVKHCFYIEVSSTPADFIANMSIACSSHRSTEAPTTNVLTTFTSTVSISTSSFPSTRSTVTSRSSTARTATPSTVMTSKTPSVSTTQIQTSSAIPTSTSYSQSPPFTNTIATHSKFTKTSTEKTSISTLKSTHTNKPTVVTSRQPTATMTDTPLVTTDKITEMTTEQGRKTTNSEEVTSETLPMSNTNSGTTEIVDSTVFGKTDSDATNGSEKSPNTQQSTANYSDTTPNNATLTDDDDIGANPERLTVVIVIATIIGIILICVLIGAIYYQKKQKRKVSLKQRMAFTNMASTIVDEERASKEDSKNHFYDNPNLIPYGHMENT